MKSAQEARELSLPENMSVRVSESCMEVLDQSVQEALESGKNKVSLILGLGIRDCTDAIKGYLEQYGYENISIQKEDVLFKKVSFNF